MLYVDNRGIPSAVETVAPFAPRRITHAFHDIDGTHSLIRDWVPVMTLVTGFTAQYGAPNAADVPALAAIIGRHRSEEFPEAHRFAIESAGLSALTQMEWALRCAVENGILALPGTVPAVNAEIVRRIWRGEEEFTELPEPETFRRRLNAMSTMLFQAYEILLLRMGRDRNLAAAKTDPAPWRVPGSLEFLRFLHACGVKNYFVTGAVIEYDGDGIPRGTMADEVRALGYDIGPGEAVEKLVGSAWNRKLPKERLMLRLCAEEAIAPEAVLIVGDGRSEIAAGVRMGALTLSRLDPAAERARAIHRTLGTHLIADRYDPAVLQCFMRAI